MRRITAICANKWFEKAADTLISSISFLVFSLLDLLDSILCIVYRFIDDFLEENGPPCYCENRGGGEEEDGDSETLYGRKNVFRHLGLFKMRRKRQNSQKMSGLMAPRWSDCSCDSCISWRDNGEQKLHLVLMEPPQAWDSFAISPNNLLSKEDNQLVRLKDLLSLPIHEDCRENSAENVIFLHGFLSSSSFWTETVFPHISETVRSNYSLFAGDLLGFGRSPKPQNCLYRLQEHVGSIEKSIIEPFQLNSFHLVAHSMGCIIALAVAAKYPNSVKSITLIAPPYFPSSKEKASGVALNRLAERSIWPPLLFGSSVMSWYEHVGRSVCFLICRNHRIWERILRTITWKRDLSLMFLDLTKHTHHSAWHTMHNVICGGAKLMDDYLEVVNKSRIPVKVIQGERDQVVPLECSFNVKLKVPLAEVQTISEADHTTVVFGRERDFTRDLEQIWSSS